MANKQAEPTSGELNIPKICVSKLKIIRPQISFIFYKKSILVGGCFGEGVGGQEKRPKDALS